MTSGIGTVTSTGSGAGAGAAVTSNFCRLIWKMVTTRRLIRSRIFVLLELIVADAMSAWVLPSPRKQTDLVDGKGESAKWGSAVVRAKEEAQ